MELLGLIEDYRQRLLPLIVPLTLLKHHLNRYPVPDWVPVPSEASGTPAGLPPSVSEGVDAAQSRLSLVVAASTGLSMPNVELHPASSVRQLLSHEGYNARNLS